MKKNVIFFEDSSKQTFGGGQKGSLQIIRILKDSFSIYLFDTNPNSVFFSRAAELIPEGFRHVIMGYGKIAKGGQESSFSIGWRELLFFPISYIHNLITVSRFLKSNSLNRHNTLFYAATKKSLLLVFALSLLSGIKIVFHARTFDRKSNPFYLLLCLSYSRCEVIICVSQFIYQHVSRPQALVAYNPLTLPQPPPKPKKIEGRMIVATISSLIHWKGIEFFLKSFSCLPDNCDIEYHIYGNGELLDPFRFAYAHERIKFMGFCDHIDDIMQNTIHVICVPSVQPEAFGRTSVEGFKYGIPAISSNIGAQPEVVKDGQTGFLVEPGDPTAIAERILLLYRQPDLYQRLSEQAITSSRRFSIDDYAKTMQNIFSAI